MGQKLTGERAAGFAAITLRNLTREYPNKLDHVLASAADVRSPRELHPIFFGCFDWHSCVHGYWQLARLLRLFPDVAAGAAIKERLDEAMTTGNVQAEVDYFKHAANAGFERPYGWAWLLALACELAEPAGDGRERWHQTLAPLAELVAGRLREFLPKAIYPVRSGAHGNSAFALTLAHDYAVAHGDQSLHALIEAAARQWYGGDVDCQAWEPSLDDFLSPSLMEAACMQRLLPGEEFGEWLARFFPRLAAGEPAAVFRLAVVSDRSDGKIAHLDGLHFSRAWCMRRLAGSLPWGDLRAGLLRDAADAHIRASLPHISGDYAGEHWLATFALLALSQGDGGR